MKITRRTMNIATAATVVLVSALSVVAVHEMRDSSTSVPVRLLPTVDVNPYGYVDADGDAGVVVNRSGSAVVKVTLQGVTADFSCTSPTAVPPVNGHYVAVSIEEAAGESFVDELKMFPAAPTDFALLDEDGERVKEGSALAVGCLAPGEELNGVVTETTPVAGTVVFDTSLTHGSVVHLPSSTEWKF